MTDMELIKLIRKSPHKGHSALINEYSRYVYAIAYNKIRRCGSEEDIEECVSDIFADVFIAVDNGETDNLKALIGTIAKRTAIDYFRKLALKDSRTVSAYENEEVEELTRKAKENKAVQHEAKATTKKPRKAPERKADEEKEHLIDCFRVFLEGFGAENVKVTNKSKIVEFDLNDSHYKVDLIRFGW